jgi:transcriptional regulator with XRE-family HTH domain
LDRLAVDPCDDGLGVVNADPTPRMLSPTSREWALVRFSTSNCTMSGDAIARQRAASRRKIEAWEAPHLEALGAEVRRLRKLTTLTVAEFAWEIEVCVQHLWRLERGVRRTRRSTLARIAEAVDAEVPELGGTKVILTRLLELTGPALAPESEYAARMDRRRARRRRKAAKGRFAHWQDDPAEDELPAELGPEELTEAPWWMPVDEPEATANAGPTWLDLCGGAGE